MNPQPFSGCSQRIGVLLASRGNCCRILLVGDAQSTTGIDVANIVSLGAQDRTRRCHALHGFAEGLNVGDLRADVHAHAGGFQVRASREPRR